MNGCSGGLRLGLRLFGLFGEGFVRPLAEGALHAAGQRDGAFAEFVADAVHGAERILPLFLRVFDLAEQVELSFSLFEGGYADAEEADGASLFPVVVEKTARGGVD